MPSCIAPGDLGLARICSAIHDCCTFGVLSAECDCVSCFIWLGVDIGVIIVSVFDVSSNPRARRLPLRLLSVGLVVLSSPIPGRVPSDTPSLNGWVRRGRWFFSGICINGLRKSMRVQLRNRSRLWHLGRLGHEYVLRPAPWWCRVFGESFFSSASKSSFMCYGSSYQAHFRYIGPILITWCVFPLSSISSGLPQVIPEGSIVDTRRWSLGHILLPRGWAR